MTIRTVKEIRLRPEARRRELSPALDRLIAWLAGMGALRIVLFGSFARGEVRSETDLDLICVMPSERSGREWMRVIYTEIDRDFRALSGAGRQDDYYIPTRDPNGLPGEVPSRYYDDKPEVEESVAWSGKVLALAREKIGS